MFKYPIINMSPPNRGNVVVILEKGRVKYGWRWLIDAEGVWWGAKSNAGSILQVEPKEPFLTRRWNETVGGGYNPTPRLAPLRELIES